MTAIDVQQVISQIRALQIQSSGRPEVAGETAGTASPASGFAAVIKSSLDAVNVSEAGAQKLQTEFERGDSSTDLASVMLATSKAQVGFKAVVEVRNRLVSAYQDIMNMSI